MQQEQELIMNKFKILALLLIFTANYSTAEINLSHEINEDTQIKSFFVDNETIVTLTYEKNKFQLIERSGLAKGATLSRYLIPWKPTHIDKFNDSGTVLIGSLADNSHSFTKDQIQFVNSGQVLKTIDNVFSFSLSREKDHVFIFRNNLDGLATNLEIYDQQANLVKSANLKQGLQQIHGQFSFANDLSSYAISSGSPDMGYSLEQKIMSGNEFNSIENVTFNNAPIYQTEIINDDLEYFHIDGAIVKRKKGKVRWKFSPYYYFIQDFQIAPNGKYILVRSSSSDSFTIIDKKGKVVVEHILESNKKNKRLEFLKSFNNDDRMISNRNYVFLGKQLIISDESIGKVHIVSLKRKQLLKSFKLKPEEALQDISPDFSTFITRNLNSTFTTHKISGSQEITRDINVD